MKTPRAEIAVNGKPVASEASKGGGKTKGSATGGTGSASGGSGVDNAGGGSTPPTAAPVPTILARGGIGHA